MARGTGGDERIGPRLEVSRTSAQVTTEESIWPGRATMTSADRAVAPPGAMITLE